jgi:hypothetical protein
MKQFEKYTAYDPVRMYTTTSTTTVPAGEIYSFRCLSCACCGMGFTHFRCACISKTIRQTRFGIVCESYTPKGGESPTGSTAQRARYTG